MEEPLLQVRRTVPLLSSRGKARCPSRGPPLTKKHPLSRRGFYEKDKATPVDPRKIPVYDDEKLASFPEGYRFLAYGQSSAYKIKMDLPQSRGALAFRCTVPSTSAR